MRHFFSEGLRISTLKYPFQTTKLSQKHYICKICLWILARSSLASSLKNALRVPRPYVPLRYVDAFITTKLIEGTGTGRGRGKSRGQGRGGGGETCHSLTFTVLVRDRDLVPSWFQVMSYHFSKSGVWYLWTNKKRIAQLVWSHDDLKPSKPIRPRDYAENKNALPGMSGTSHSPHHHHTPAIPLGRAQGPAGRERERRNWGYS